MEDQQNDLMRRTDIFAGPRNLILVDRLGFGIHGTAFTTDRHTAIGVHEPHRTYLTERNVYLRPLDRGVTTLLGHHVPELVG